ncbi:MAG: flagellar basal-body MS-ring/collar protein FliF [Bdellovibrionota bacterium]|mgnify:CR=1 FL=1
MQEYFRRVTTQIAEFMKSLSPSKKVAMLATGLGILAGLVLLFMWAGNTTYAPLMTNLNAEDSANIIRILREKRIPFKVDVSGKNISIPSESIYEFRLELATMGIPQSGVVGYEVFDKQSIGATSFVQRINQKRALEGELMRTIGTIRGVRRSRVHLAVPQKSAFVEDQKKSTASVVVDLEAGVVLSEKQVYGISNLIARAVEGMEVADVVIVDSNGKVLSKNQGDPLAAASASQLDFQQKIEGDIEKRIEAMLSKVVGDGHVVAKVTADVDFSQVSETQTLFDPDGSAVRSVDKRSDAMNGTRPGSYGAAGAASNLPGQPPVANNEIKNATTKNAEIINYEVPQTIRKTTRPAGNVKKLSVAVVVDGKTVKSVEKGGKVLSKVEPWPPEKLKEFESIIASAAGIDRSRGDSLEIRNMEFTREDFEEASMLLAERERKAYVQNMITYGVIGITIVLFFFFVVKPFIRWITENTIESVDTYLPQTIEELERLQAGGALVGMDDTMAPIGADSMDPEKTEGEMIREKIVTLVDGSPHKAALILKDWLHVDAKKQGEKDEDGGKEKSA